MVLCEPYRVAWYNSYNIHYIKKYNAMKPLPPPDVVSWRAVVSFPQRTFCCPPNWWSSWGQRGASTGTQAHNWIGDNVMLGNLKLFQFFKIPSLREPFWENTIMFPFQGGQGWLRLCERAEQQLRVWAALQCRHGLWCAQVAALHKIQASGYA